MNTRHLSIYLATAAGLSSMVCRGTPSPGPSTDGERADFLQVAYESSPRLSDTAVKVTIKDHISTLSGNVTTIDQADYATAIALATDGVYGVVNQLEVKKAANSEDDLSSKLAASFAQTDVLDASSIQVSSEMGELTLHGTVSTFDERELARELASRIEGVQRITNRLEIVFSQPRSEHSIQKQLEMQFNDDPLFDQLPVNIAVNGGTLTLSGSVGSLDEKERLERTSLVTGVMEVNSSKLEINSDLKIEGMGDKDYHPSDSLKVARLVLEADPRVDASSIELEMVGGTLLLNGSVSNSAAQTAAEADARGVPGVLGVINRLRTNTALSVR